MAIDLGDIIRVTAIMAEQGHTVQNVYHLYVGGTESPPFDGGFVETVADWIDAVYSSLSPLQHTGFTYVSLRFENLSNDTALGNVPWPDQTAGTGGAAQLPPAVTALSLFTTNAKKSVGKKFWGGIVADEMDQDGTPSGDLVNALATMGVLLLIGAGDDDWTVIPGNQRFNEAGEPTLHVPWQACTVPNKFATQRRRYVGVGS